MSDILGKVESSAGADRLSGLVTVVQGAAPLRNPGGG